MPSIRFIPSNALKDFRLELARGNVPGKSGIHKFGANPAIPAGNTEDVTFSGVINWLTAATTVRIKAGGDAADDSGGNGARTITVVGLDENFVDAEEDITTNGTSASTVTTITFIRVFRALVKTVGVYTAANTAAITVENGAGGTDLITIGAGEGQTETSEFTIPAGKTAYLTHFDVTVDATKPADAKMYQRQNADDVSAPFTGKRLIAGVFQLEGESTDDFGSYVIFPAKTDLWWEATAGAGAASEVSIDYDLILVDD